MKNNLTTINHPIDVQYLMHEAYENVALLVEKMAEGLQNGGDLTELKTTFGLWGKHLHYHAQTEDDYMTGPIKNNQAARNNEAEHNELASTATAFGNFLKKGDIATLEKNFASILEFEDIQHQELEDAYQKVEELLKNEIGENAITSRTRRHIFSQIVALRVLMFDHFDNEETFVFPIVRESMDEKQQIELSKLLLFDLTSEDPRWIIDCIYDNLHPSKRKLLLEFENKLINQVD